MGDKMTELYTPDEAKMFYNGFLYALFHSSDNKDIYEATSILLNNKDKFSKILKSSFIDITNFFIEAFDGEGLLESRKKIKELKRFVKEF